jgi:hypothetical protein
MKNFAAIFSLVFELLIFTASANSQSAKFPFQGVFASGVTPEAITPSDLELNCILQPTYNDEKGNLLSFKLDLPYFRLSGKYRYRIVDIGYLQKFDATNKIITLLPDKESLLCAESFFSKNKNNYGFRLHLFEFSRN